MPWIEAAEQHLCSWELDLSDTTCQQEIADFWEKDAKHERKTVDNMRKKLADMTKRKEATKQKESQEKKQKKQKQQAVSEKTKTSQRKSRR